MPEGQEINYAFPNEVTGPDEVNGTVHWGIHEIAEEACNIANRAAGARASRKGTCATLATPDLCQFVDGKYKARAVSANHKGSCGSGYERRGYIPIYTWDGTTGSWVIGS